MPRALLRCRELPAKFFSNQTARSFREGKLVREAAFQEHPDTIVPRQVRRCDGSHVFAYAEVDQTVGPG
jgi:hypothetical protein